VDLVAYLRISSESQIDGYGLELQREAIRAWARSDGHRVVHECVDVGVPGTRDAVDRPGLTEALDWLRPPPKGRGLVVARIDRLARRLDVQETVLGVCWKAGASVFTVAGEVQRDDADDPMRKFVRQVMGGVAELERSLVESRLRAGRAAKAAAGKHAVGAHRYGMTSGGPAKDSITNPVEQAALTRILELRAQGQSYRAICATLDSEGLRPRRAAAWSPAVVRVIAQRAGTGKEQL
jgi:DNA invertase Pin-like site-specific DNA recombinase